MNAPLRCSEFVGATAKGFGSEQERRAEKAHAAAQVLALHAIPLVGRRDVLSEQLRWRRLRQVALTAVVRAVGGQQLAARLFVRERTAVARQRVAARDVADRLPRGGVVEEREI